MRDSVTLCLATPGSEDAFKDVQHVLCTRALLQALMADSVSLYLAAPGSEDSFHHAVMHSYLQSGQRQRFFHAADFGCGVGGEELGV